MTGSETHTQAEIAEAAPLLATMVYRSRATVPMEAATLQDLLRSAQVRNQAEGITGLLVYDQGSFFQWLEGPTESVARVWNSVRRDPRHTDVEVLETKPTQTRFFADWDMRLATRRGDEHTHKTNFAEIAPALMDSLYRRPGAASSLLASLAPKPIGHNSGGMDPRQTGATLRRVLESVVIPRLAARHGGAALRAPAIDPQAAELAKLAIAADPQAAFDLVAQVHARAGSFAPLCASLFEPAARSLGDLWDTDDCSELDVTLGLMRLQTAVRRMTEGMNRGTGLGLPVVLVTPQPGEVHLLGAALDAEMLWQAGWDAHAEFPRSDSALQELVAGNWFDVVDLSLSPAFRREDSLSKMARTIERVREASMNPSLVVVVGGRLFVDRDDAGVAVGADASMTSSGQVGTVALQALRPRR